MEDQYSEEVEDIDMKGKDKDGEFFFCFLIYELTCILSFFFFIFFLFFLGGK